MTGREAYEEDVRRCPRYDDGSPRLPWDALPEIAQWSWNRSPTAREHGPSAAYAGAGASGAIHVPGRKE